MLLRNCLNHYQAIFWYGICIYVFIIIIVEKKITINLIVLTFSAKGTGHTLVFFGWMLGNVQLNNWHDHLLTMRCVIVVAIVMSNNNLRHSVTSLDNRLILDCRSRSHYMAGPPRWWSSNFELCLNFRWTNFNIQKSDSDINCEFARNWKKAEYNRKSGKKNTMAMILNRWCSAGLEDGILHKERSKRVRNE